MSGPEASELLLLATLLLATLLRCAQALRGSPLSTGSVHQTDRHTLSFVLRSVTLFLSTTATTPSLPDPIDRTTANKNKNNAGHHKHREH